MFGEAAARAVASGECERGIVVCTTGIGISIAANKVKGIRCAHVCDSLCAKRAAGTMMQICWRWALELRVSIWLSGVWKCFLTTPFEGGPPRAPCGGDGCDRTLSVRM